MRLTVPIMKNHVSYVQRHADHKTLSDAYRAKQGGNLYELTQDNKCMEIPISVISGANNGK